MSQPQSTFKSLLASKAIYLLDKWLQITLHANEDDLNGISIDKPSAKAPVGSCQPMTHLNHYLVQQEEKRSQEIALQIKESQLEEDDEDMEAAYQSIDKPKVVLISKATDIQLEQAKLKKDNKKQIEKINHKLQRVIGQLYYLCENFIILSHVKWNAQTNQVATISQQASKKIPLTINSPQLIERSRSATLIDEPSSMKHTAKARNSHGGIVNDKMDNISLGSCESVHSLSNVAASSSYLVLPVKKIWDIRLLGMNGVGQDAKLASGNAINDRVNQVGKRTDTLITTIDVSANVKEQLLTVAMITPVVMAGLN